MFLRSKRKRSDFSFNDFMKDWFQTGKAGIYMIIGI